MRDADDLQKEFEQALEAGTLEIDKGVGTFEIGALRACRAAAQEGYAAVSCARARGRGRSHRVSSCAVCCVGRVWTMPSRLRFARIPSLSDGIICIATCRSCSSRQA